MQKLIRWGIWGTGVIAHQVASDFQLAPGSYLQAVASRTGERAEQFAAEHGAKSWYEGLEALLEDSEVEVVYIATPNHCHLDDCLACIRAGKAVLCEKPFALNLEQANLIAEAAKLHKVFCMEAMWTRFIPAVIDVKQRISNGEIGPVRLMQGNFSYPTARETENRLFDIRMGGGVLLDRGVYLVSLAQHLLGTPDVVRGTATMGPTGVDEQSTYQLIFGGDAIADLSASLLVRGTNDCVVSGERGSLRLCEPFYCAHRVESQSFGTERAGQGGIKDSSSGAKTFVQRVRNDPTAKFFRRRLTPLLELLRQRKIRDFSFRGDGYQFQLMEVNRCLRDGRIESEVMPLRDSLEVMKIMDTLRYQWKLKYPQELSETQT